VVSISKHRSPAASDTISNETDSSSILPAFPTLCTTESANTKQREKTARQLRALFAYPLVYILAWLFPFVSHVLRYDGGGDGDGSPPFWLLVLGIVSLCVQGAVDCALFMAREKPWRYAQGRGLWLSLRRRWTWCLGGWWCFGGDGGSGSRAGRTREEMLVDGRLARKRRQEELAVEREAVRLRMGDGGRGRGREREWEREWWEVHEVYGDDCLDPGRGFEGPTGDEEGWVALHYASR
jgi:G protein-coupled receptor GPR1